MAEKPILFNTEMVQAILAGFKTQTRRLIKAPVLYEVSEPPDRIEKVTLSWADYQFTWNGKAIGGFELKAPYRPGDVLWVRETWAKDAGRYMYRANYSDTEKFYMNGREIKMTWRPSIHMPRTAARLFLNVTGVRVERLQDMTENDAYSEGYHGMPWCHHLVFDNYPDTPISCVAYGGHKCPTDPPCDKSIPELFGETIWNPTVQKADLPRYGWDANPWVWAYEFERIARR